MTNELQLPGPPLAPGSAAVTVGTFDGVHLGHQAVLEQLHAVARQHGLRSLVLTFEPHPLRIVRPQAAPRLLCTAREKLELLQATKVDQVAVVPFTPAMAELLPRQFVERVLIAHFGLQHLVIGYDHGFGKQRSGDTSTLQELGQELGYSVTIVPHTDLDARPVSSTRIRLALSDGDVFNAARALGRPYSFDGTVVRGDRRGRDLGFPTANLDNIEPFKLLPADGIYAVRVFIDRSEPGRPGLLHLGPRPTFSGATAAVEVHLLDFQEDLYERVLRVALCDRIRGIERFASTQLLVEAMQRDAARARQLFETERGSC